MQSIYLIMTKGYTEKQVGTLFFVFGISQCIFIGPAGYFLDYSNSKINWVVWSSIVVSAMVVFTAVFAIPNGENLIIMIMFKFIQGAATSFLPPGFNGITLGIVGSTGFTQQVSRNKMMNHLGTALVVAIASLIAYGLYPTMGLLFITSPIACIGFVYNILKIKPTDVNIDAASSLIIRSPTMTEYETFDEQNEIAEIMSQAEQNEDGEYIFDENDSESDGDSSDYCPPEAYLGQTMNQDDKTNKPSNQTLASRLFEKGPSMIFDLPSKGRNEWKNFKQTRADLAVLLDRNLILFTLIFFLFNLSNSAILPLVMQSLAFDDMRQQLLMSGLCIMIAQTFMMFFAKISGDYSPIWGRKGLFTAALFSLPIRCAILVLLLTLKPKIVTPAGVTIMNFFMLSTQILDAVGAGISGTLYILITNDISGGTGRFSLMMGITSGAMCLGCTISGYLGQSLAEDYGYREAILFLGLISLIPAFMYLFFMPETLPAWIKSEPKKRRRKLITLFLEMNKRRKRVSKKLSAKFGKKKKDITDEIKPPDSNLGGASAYPNDTVISRNHDATKYVQMV